MMVPVNIMIYKQISFLASWREVNSKFKGVIMDILVKSLLEKKMKMRRINIYKKQLKTVSSGEDPMVTLNFI